MTAHFAQALVAFGAIGGFVVLMVMSGAWLPALVLIAFALLVMILIGATS